MEATGEICYADSTRLRVYYTDHKHEGSDDPEGGLKMARENRVKHIMAPIEEYNIVKEDDRLCEAIRILMDTLPELLRQDEDR